jgi:hypothetical protein
MSADEYENRKKLGLNLQLVQRNSSNTLALLFFWELYDDAEYFL